MKRRYSLFLLSFTLLAAVLLLVRIHHRRKYDDK